MKLLIALFCGLVCVALAYPPTVAPTKPKPPTKPAPKPVTPPNIVLKNDKKIYPDGSYSYTYETSNGIVGTQSSKIVKEGNSTRQIVTGSYSYPDTNGKKQVVHYISDEKGYRVINKP